jgi:hypothetical protein
MRATRTARGFTSAVVIGALAAGALAVPARGTAEVTSPGAVPSVAQIADEAPHTRLSARMTGPWELRFFVRPKLPKGENWKVIVKAKECGPGKKWVTVFRGTTKTRQEWVKLSALNWRKLKEDDGKYSAIRAYRLITPEQRGYTRTVKTFRNYPLDNAGFIRIGTC